MRANNIKLSDKMKPGLFLKVLSVAQLLITTSFGTKRIGKNILHLPPKGDSSCSLKPGAVRTTGCAPCVKQWAIGLIFENVFLYKYRSVFGLHTPQSIVNATVSISFSSSRESDFKLVVHYHLLPLTRKGKLTFSGLSKPNTGLLRAFFHPTHYYSGK